MRRLMQKSCELSSRTRRCSNQSGAAFKTSDAALRVPWCCSSRKTWKMPPPSARNWTKPSVTRLQHTTMIEIRDLDECTTKVEIADALSTSLNAPHFNKDVVKTLRKAYAGTQAAVAALPDDLAAKALILGHIRIGWVNCRIHGREDTLRCYRCWSPGHVSTHCKGSDPSAHCFRGGQTGHQTKVCKKNPTVYTPLRLTDVEFSALLTNIIEEAWDKRPLIVAVDFNAWSTEWGCRVTRQRGTTLLVALDTLEAALLNTGDTPTFAGALGYSGIDLTFASDILAPRITSCAVSELYTHSDHQAIVFEIETARPPRPTTRQSCKWNARTLDSESLLVMIANAAVPPGPTEKMAMRLMATITSACDASMAETSHRRPLALMPASAKACPESTGACRRIKYHTAPGPDGVPNSAIKIAIATHPDIFLQVYTACLQTGVFPAFWKRERLALPPKPGKPPEEPSSYRPLCMLHTAGKILERIICDRLEATTERPGGLSDHQYGFRKGRSTINAIENVIATAREAIAGKRWNRVTKKYCAVVTLDVKNAFNSARWNNINAALRRMGTPEYLLRIVASYLSARELDYDTDDGPESYRVTAGVP
ncbi:unnamed protein product [Trichogramma brassicae]|uniref:CCHC-type domain-containing protein n=1 Tax=Trichogramma brassicae TaxID=86971 RepID=A0A6H5I825_9HYME|nr:unnamed protein product [Trichogramma brassicae]